MESVPKNNPQRANVHHLSAKPILLRSWAAIGICILFILLMQAIGIIMPAIQLVLWGVIIGFMCSPITNFLEDKGLGRAGAAFIALAVVLGIAILVLFLIVPPFISQLVGLLQEVPSYVQEAQNWLSQFLNTHGSSDSQAMSDSLTSTVASLSRFASEQASNLASRLSAGVITNLVSTIEHIFTFFLGLVMAYWFAKDYPRLMHEATILAGPEHEQDTTLMVAVIARSMGGYMRGIVITSFVGGLLSFLGFTLIGHPYAGLMGIIVGVLHFIPVIGPWLAAGLAMVLALVVSPVLAIESLLVSVVAQNVTDNVVSPLVMQSAVQVHPILSLTALILGSALGGVMGMALAIPMSAALKGVFVYYFESRTGRQIVSYEGALFRGTPFHDAQGNILPSFDALDDDKYFEHTRLVGHAHVVEVHAARRPETKKNAIAALIEKTRRYNGLAHDHTSTPGSDDTSADESAHDTRHD